LSSSTDLSARTPPGNCWKDALVTGYKPEAEFPAAKPWLIAEIAIRNENTTDKN
jgi:hypothetical protein